MAEERVIHTWSKAKRLVALIAVVAVGLTAAWGLYLSFASGMIADAYRGESLPFLNRIISGQSDNPLQWYLDRAASMMRDLTIGGIVFAAFASLLIVDPSARARVCFMGPLFAIFGILVAAIVFVYPLEIETRESTVWLHILAMRSGIDIYDHGTVAFTDMNHGPLGPVLRFWIAGLMPFLEPWQVVRLFVLLIPFAFLFVGWKLVAQTPGASRTQTLFLASIGFVILLVSSREFLLVGRSDGIVTIFLLVALYAAFAFSPRTVPQAWLLGIFAGLLGIGTALTNWRVAPAAFGVFVFTLWRYSQVGQASRRILWNCAAACGLSAVAAWCLVILVVFHGDLRLYFGHFFSLFLAEVGPGLKHYPGSLVGFAASLFNPYAPVDAYKGGPLALAAVTYWITWAKGDATARALRYLSFFVLAACIVGYYQAWVGGGAWHFIPFLIVLWAYLCVVQASIPPQRLAWLGVFIVALMAVNARTVVAPTVNRALHMREAKAFEQLEESLAAGHTVLSEDLFFYRRAYGGELIDMGEDTPLLVRSGAIDPAYDGTVQRHFDRLRRDPPEIVITGVGGSPALAALVRDKYVLLAEGPGNLTGNGSFATRLYRREDVVLKDKIDE